MGEFTSGYGLALFSEIGLLISMIAFIAMAVRIWLRRNKDAYESAAALPLDDDMPTTGHEDRP